MPQTIHHIAFNSFQDVFSVAGDFGIRVFNTYPIVELVNLKAELVGSIKLVALLNRSNLIFMVAGEPCPKFSSKTLMIWDNEKQKFVVELTVNSPILNVLVSLSKIVVVQHSHIHVFSMCDFKLVTYEETGNNPFGLCALSPNPKNEYLVFPSFKIGTIQVVNLRNVSHQRSIAPATIPAHESDVVKLAIDNQATKIATGSKTGTWIRVFDTYTKQLLYEFRRGAHSAQLFSLRFSPDSSYMVCSSDQGTIHVFNANPRDEDFDRERKNIVDQLILKKGQYTSLKKFTMPHAEHLSECAFITKGDSNSNLELVAVTKDAHYFYFSALETKPQGYELLFNLSFDQEFWKL